MSERDDEVGLSQAPFGTAAWAIPYWLRAAGDKSATEFFRQIAHEVSEELKAEVASSGQQLSLFAASE